MSADAPIGVALVEDDETTRQRLVQALAGAPRIELRLAAADARQILDWLGANRVDVLLVDLGLPDRSGLDVIRWCRQHQPAAEVMVVTMFGDEANMIQAFEAGAHGYLLKDGSEADLARHVLALHSGGSPMTPLIARQLLERLPASTGAPGIPVGRHRTDLDARATAAANAGARLHLCRGRAVAGRDALHGTVARQEHLQQAFRALQDRGHF